MGSAKKVKHMTEVLGRAVKRLIIVKGLKG